MASERIELLCDVLDNQRNLTKWYLKRIPEGMETTPVIVDGVKLNTPYWQVAHLIWTDYSVGLKALGYKGSVPEWINHVGFGSSGEIPESMPAYADLLQVFTDSHTVKLDFLRTLTDEVLDADYAIPSLRFKNNYYALLHLARHEGVHCGHIAAFCKLNGIKTI